MTKDGRKYSEHEADQIKCLNDALYLCGLRGDNYRKFSYVEWRNTYHRLMTERGVENQLFGISQGLTDWFEEQLLEYGPIMCSGYRSYKLKEWYTDTVQRYR